MYDVLILGAGPAGLSAGMYAARKNLSTVVITNKVPSAEDMKDPGMTFVVEAFKAFMSAPGKILELKKELHIVKLEKNIVSFSVEDRTGKVYYGRSVVIATGEDGQGSGNTDFDDITDKTSSGHIKVDANMQTNVPGAFAAGHVNASTGKDTFVAAAQGAQAAENAAKYLKST